MVSLILSNLNHLGVSRNAFAKKLGYAEIEYSSVDYINPPYPIYPYRVTSDGIIVRYRVNTLSGDSARFPKDVSTYPKSLIAQVIP